MGRQAAGTDTLLVRPAAAQDAAGVAMLLGVLGGEPGPARDIVLLNAGVALYAANVAADIQAGIALARTAIDSGAAKQRLEQLVVKTHALKA